MRTLRRGRFRVDDETIRWWGRVSIGSRGCVLEVTEMDGNKAIAPPTKSEQNRSRCNCCSRGGGIVETIIEPGGTGCAVCNSVRGYRTCNCFGSNNVRRKNSVGGHRLDIAWYIAWHVQCIRSHVSFNHEYAQIRFFLNYVIHQLIWNVYVCVHVARNIYIPIVI